MQRSPEAIYAKRWLILSVLCLSLVMVVVANSSLNVAIPALSRELGASSSELQWIIDAYAIVFAGLLLFAGALGDRFGRKGAMQIGLVLFGLGTTVATLADSPGQLIACRAAMGVGAAFVMPGTLSILATVFPAQERAKAIAIWAAFAGAGGALGLLLSGFLLDHFWWGSIFFINIPLVIVALASGALILPTSRDPSQARFDVPGAVLSILGLGSLIYSIIEGPEKGWLTAETLGLMAVSVAIITVFIVWERRCAHPMLDLSLFSNRSFTVGCSTIFLGFMAMLGMFFVVSQYLQSVQGHSPFNTGVRLLPFTLAMMVAAPRSAALVERLGARRVVTTGLIFNAVGLAILGTLAADSSYLHFMAGGIMMGAGMGLTMPPSTGAIMTSLPLGKAGVGSAVNDTTREVGIAVGVAVIGSIVSSRYRSSLGDLDRFGVPAEVSAAAREGVSRAVLAAGQLPDSVPGGRELVEAARSAFMDGMHAAMFAAAAITVVAAVLASRFMPDRPTVVAATSTTPSTAGADADNTSTASAPSATTVEPG